MLMAEPPEPRSLAGQRILLSRPEEGESSAAERTQALIQALRDAGAEVVSVSLTRIVAVRSARPNRERFDWVFFTSRNAVRQWASQKCQQEEALSDLPIGVIGPGTAEAVIECLGAQPAFIAPVGEGRAAAEAFLAVYGSDLKPHVLWPCAEEARPGFSQTLRAAGVQVTPWVVYRSECVATTPESLATDERLTGAIFTSPSAVLAFCQLGLSLEPGAWAACLGPSTAAAIRKHLPQARLLQPELPISLRDLFPFLCEALISQTASPDGPS
jgi:uroporphyrinogen-III synthase